MCVTSCMNVYASNMVAGIYMCVNSCMNLLASNMVAGIYVCKFVYECLCE